MTLFAGPRRHTSAATMISSIPVACIKYPTSPRKCLQCETAIHAQYELACFLWAQNHLIYCLVTRDGVELWTCFIETSRYRAELTAQPHQGSLGTGELKDHNLYSVDGRYQV